MKALGLFAASATMLSAAAHAQPVSMDVALDQLDSNMARQEAILSTRATAARPAPQPKPRVEDDARTRRPRSGAGKPPAR